jgi:hypothetical protein
MFGVFSNKKRQRSEASSKALNYSVLFGSLLIAHPCCLTATGWAAFPFFLKRSEASSKALSYSVLKSLSALSSIRPAYRQSGCSPLS